MDNLYIQCEPSVEGGVKANVLYFQVPIIHFGSFFDRIITSATERATTTPFRVTDRAKAQIFTCAIRATNAIGIGIIVIPNNIVMMLQMKVEPVKPGKLIKL